MECIAPKLIWPHRSEEWLEKYEERPVSVPCGKCLACLTRKRNEWTFRLEIEHRYSAGALFVTLTYDQKHNPYGLQKRDCQLFLKRLRKKVGRGVRYYLVGEYGSKFGRPHYHVLLFGCTDKQAIKSSWCDRNGDPIGLVHFGNVTQASVAYCTKYVIQKADETTVVDGRGTEIQKPFTLMSRGYGIGGRYLTDEMVQWHREDDRNYILRDGRQLGLPAFYRRKIWYTEADRTRVGTASAAFLIKRREKEIQFYRDRYGERWLQVMNDARDCVLARIKSKIAFTQKF